MRKEERVERVLNVIDEMFPDAKCELKHKNPWQLLIAVMMSAQTTDKSVNAITEHLFQKYQSVDDFANADLKEWENDIRKIGLYRNKAKNIILACRMLLEKYNGVMPSDINELTKIPGVGRKTANVVRSHIFNLPSIVVDTHVKRISKKVGFTESDDPVKIEFELMEIFPKEHWIRYNTQVIAHGRKICKARKPECEACCLRDYCDEYLSM